MTQDPQVSPQDKQHHFLVMGEVVYLPPGDDSPHTLRLNGIFVCPTKELGLKHLGRCQQILQLNFHQRMSQVMPEPPDVKEVILHSFTHLGHMTKEEFFEGSES